MRKAALLVFTFTALSLFGESFGRDIFTLEHQYLSDNTNTLRVEDVALFYISDSLILEARIDAKFSEYFQRYLLQTGLVYVWKDGLYSELVYGAALDQSGSLSHEGFAETTYEKGRFLASLRFKAGFYPESNTSFMAPDMGLMYAFTPLYSLKSKYFFGLDSKGTLTNTLQFENRFKWSERVSTDLVTTGSVISEGSSDILGYEIGVKGNFLIRDNFQLRYFLNYLKPDEKVWGLQNSLTLDLKY